MRRPRGKATALDGNAVRTERTRGRVLAASLALFNAHGEANVTTAMIAGALDMSPGNLYYHFRGKDQIVGELFARFEARVDIGSGAGEGGAAALEDLWLYLHLLLEAIWEYRFLYRNLDDLLSRNRGLREHFARIVARQLEAVTGLCEGLVRSGAMRARGDEIRALARNVLIVASYWLGFQALQGRARGEGAATEAMLGLGAYQVMALVAPYLRGEARRHFERLSRTYID